MSRDRRGNGVQVVGGSNPPCPTKPPFQTPTRPPPTREGAKDFQPLGVGKTISQSLFIVKTSVQSACAGEGTKCSECVSDSSSVFYRPSPS